MKQLYIWGIVYANSSSAVVISNAAASIVETLKSYKIEVVSICFYNAKLNVKAFNNDKMSTQ